MKLLLLTGAAFVLWVVPAAAQSDSAKALESNASFAPPAKEEVIAPQRLPTPEPPEEITSIQTGLASWYGGKFQGRRTANGEIFDTNKLTAAHKELPFGSRVRVVNIESGESVVVTINDRGPFVEDRIIDLSRAAAEAIGISGLGVAPVRLEVLGSSAEPAFHSIQVGSFSNPDNAEQLVAELQNKDIPAEIRQSDRGHHRVVVARIPQEALDRYRERLANAGYPDVLVKSIP